jgi:hypothetical protein
MEKNELIIYLSNRGYSIEDISQLTDCNITYVCTVIYTYKIPKINIKTTLQNFYSKIVQFLYR